MTNIRKREDCIGEKYNKLTIIQIDEERNLIELKRYKNNEIKNKRSCYYLCQCECGHVISVLRDWLVRGNTKTCGYCDSDIKKDYTKKENKYELFDDYGICYMNNNNKQCFFDIEEYEKLKGHSWTQGKTGYAEARIKGKLIHMHRLIMEETDSKILIDYSNNNTLDNRKFNLRRSNKSKNGMNREKPPSNNKTGIIGVSLTRNNTYRVYITNNHKWIGLGNYLDKEEAIKVRLQAEKEYFKEFAPQIHLFEQYGIEV